MSRIRAIGRSNSAPYLRSIWALTWVPSPSVKRPFDRSWRSFAWWASWIGLRGKAMATFVASSSEWVRSGREDQRGEHVVGPLEAERAVEAEVLEAASVVGGRPAISQLSVELHRGTHLP